MKKFILRVAILLLVFLFVSLASGNRPSISAATTQSKEMTLEQENQTTELKIFLSRSLTNIIHFHNSLRASKH